MGYCQARMSLRAGHVNLITVHSGKTLDDAFGHVFLQIQDPVRHIDRTYSYELPDIGSTQFYGQLLQGELRGQLTLIDLTSPKKRWFAENIPVQTDDVHLSERQIQRLFDALETQRRPENRAYRYDFLYDNASTRIRDVLIQSCGDSIVLQTTDSLTSRFKFTFRDQIKSASWQHPWLTFGINLLLGAPADRQTTAWTSMFLPEQLHRELGQAKIQEANEKVERFLQEIDFEWDSEREYPSLWWTLLQGPDNLNFLYLGLFLGLSWWERKQGQKIVWPVWIDWLLFGLTGLIGWILVWFWIGPAHGLSDWNPSLLIFIPIYFPLIFFVIQPQRPAFHQIFFRAVKVLLLVQLLIGPIALLAGIHISLYNLLVVSFLLNNRAQFYAPPLTPSKKQPKTA